MFVMSEYEIVVHFRLILLLKSTQYVPRYKLLRLHAASCFGRIYLNRRQSLTSDVTQLSILYSRLPEFEAVLNISRHFAGVYCLNLQCLYTNTQIYKIPKYIPNHCRDGCMENMQCLISVRIFIKCKF